MARTGFFGTLIAGVVVGSLFFYAGCKSPDDAAQSPEIAVVTGSGAETATGALAERPEQSRESTTDAAEVVKAEATPVVSLALKFAPGQTATYRVTTEAEKHVLWEGDTAAKPASFKGGSTGNRVEMIFVQHIDEVTDRGHGIATITIKTLKYVGRVQDEVTLDFDSTRAADDQNPLAALIGASYQVEWSPKGEVVTVRDAEAAREAVQGSSPDYRTAQRLLKADVIEARHEVPALEAASAEDVHPGQSWSSVKSLAFGMMGAKAYERVYTLKEVADGADGPIAVVEMQGIPSAARAAELHKDDTASLYATMFDNIEHYTGQLELNLDTGQIAAYVEQFGTEWVAADTTTAETGAKPAAIKMGVTRLYRLERVK